MTLLAGCFSLNDQRQVSSKLKSDLKSNLRRVNDSRGQTISADRGSFFVVKWDSEAFGEPAWVEGTDGSISTLVGDPLYTDTTERISRTKQLERLNLFEPDIADKLAATRGSFSLAAYSSINHSLRLATDALGIRSIYYCIQDGVFIFSSTLRTLEAAKSISKRISIVGMAEQCIYGQPLASRSPYQDIFILRESELLIVSESGIEISRYYDWSKSESSPQSKEECAEWLHQIFVDSVRHRAIPGERAFAFLSGGMDSRAIVATLMDCGNPVLALNFSPDGSQDQGYAVRFVEEAGKSCQLFCLPRNEDPNFSLLAYKAKLSLEGTCSLSVQRPEMIWSGDGGSVGLGHVYMDEHMLDLCENGGVEKTVQYFTKLHRHYLPVGGLAASWRKQLPAMIFQNVVAELKRYPRKDVGRQIYLYLLFNDQRRHLAKHFETIDEHGLEFLTPFFDSIFLRAVASTPVRWGVLHKLYALWFTQLPEYAQKTPWQTYRGHVKCPIQVSDNLGYQWISKSENATETVTERLRLAWQLTKVLNTPNQEGLFSKARILAYAIMHAIGVLDGRYILQTIQKVKHFQDIIVKSD